MAEPRHRIVVAIDRPTRRRVMIAIAVALVLFAGFAVYRVTRATAVSDFEAATSERDRLLAERRQLTRELRAAKSEAQGLRDQVAYLTRSQQIDEGACVEVKQSLGQLQAESAELREQLAFYRGIVSPQQAVSGVRVYEFRVSPLATAPNAFRYDLVLIQPVRSDKRVGGQADVVFEGLENGAKRRLALADVAVDGVRSLVFSFRYFEEFGGELRFPPSFRPVRAIISLQSGGTAGPGVDDEYEWVKILQQGSRG